MQWQIPLKQFKKTPDKTSCSDVLTCICFLYKNVPVHTYTLTYAAHSFNIK